jgi:hypothetical protein
MSHSMREILSRNRADNLVGREVEISRLLKVVLSADPAVIHVHGIGGIGKSSLLLAFAREAQGKRVRVIQMDCRNIEPSEKGFLSALAQAMGSHMSSVAEAAAALEALSGTVVVALDSYEVFRMMDTWVRMEFVPSLTDKTRILLLGREGPVSRWLVAPEWQGVFHSMILGPIDEEASVRILKKSGVSDDEIPRIVSFAHGHPLALRLSAAAVLERPDLDIEAIASQSVITELTRTYISDIKDPEIRFALEASSVVRRMTASLLKYVLPSVDANSIFPELQAQPFVEMANDGLVIHDSVQQAIASSLKASDPIRYREFRRRAWEFYRKEVDIITQSEIWRYSADMLYLIDQPLIHQAFFPSNLQPISLEKLAPEDAPTVQEIIARFEGPEGKAVLCNWLTCSPESFTVARQKDGSVAGFYILFDPRKVSKGIMRADPVTMKLIQQLEDDPHPANQDAMICRKWLDAETGERMSDVITAIFLDIKSYYIAMKPRLRRLYCTRIDHDEYSALFRSLAFRYLQGYTADLDGQTNHTDMLDFGPGLFNGWITRLVGVELAIDEQEVLDAEACELVVNGSRVGLTPLELGVMQYLQLHEGEVVRRGSLIEDVWGYSNFVGSNVVDTKIRSLRKKLGRLSPSIETVAGLGYRYRRL